MPSVYGKIHFVKFPNPEPNRVKSAARAPKDFDRDRKSVV